ncbi:MAG: PP2C family protein-serine/threonine phosphatase [Anaerolineae bacterium]
MINLLFSAAERFRPAAANIAGLGRQVAVAEAAVILLYALPLTGGLVWLAIATVNATVTVPLTVLALLLVLLIAFKRFDFLIVTEFRPGMYSSFSGNVEDVLTWSSVLLFGPLVVWINLVAEAINTLMTIPGPVITADERWQASSALVVQQTGNIFAALIGLAVYQTLGGTVPLGGMDALVPALWATGARMIVVSLLTVPMVSIYNWTLTKSMGTPQRGILPGILQASSISLIGSLLAVPIAGLYSQISPLMYSVFVLSALAGSWLAHQLSLTIERNRRRSREMEQLERLARAIINGPPDGSGLEEALRDHIPGMFSFGRVAVRVFDRDLAITHPAEWDGADEALWRWLRTQTNEGVFREGNTAPWSDAPLDYALITIPIRSGEVVTGGVVVGRRIQSRRIEEVAPAARALAAQVESAINSARAYQDRIAFERSAQELEVAGQIQQSFLSGVQEAPHHADWSLYFGLRSARETSGDFFDEIPLPGGCTALVDADVADKGLGAALYMALSRTLLRTYAQILAEQYPMQPSRVLEKVNRRILSDTRAELFVTHFLGILNPETGEMVYANAGHNPPLLLRAGSTDFELLLRTGIPLGILDDREWDETHVTLAPGDILVAYTDGITEAQNAGQTEYGLPRLEACVRTHAHQPASTIGAQILEDVDAFVAGAPQFDDLTLMVMRRSPPEDMLHDGHSANGGGE